jgi:hypothetical protein
VCILSRTEAADKVASFSELSKGDELHMTFTTSGCFHYASYELTFRRSAEITVSIVQFERKWSPKLKAYTSTNRITLGELSLTRGDVEGLDRLLHYYRSSPGDGCTTVDKVSISQRHDEKVVASEQFVDGSCFPARMDMTKITELIVRLEKKK